MGVASLFGVFAGTYFWFPKMSGRMMNETLGKIHFWIHVHRRLLHLHAFPLSRHRRQRSPLPVLRRRFHGSLPADLHKFITICALITGAAQFIFLFNLIYSRFKGAPAPDNPWNGTSLEWSIPSPPPWNNFGGHHPSFITTPISTVSTVRKAISSCRIRRRLLAVIDAFSRGALVASFAPRTVRFKKDSRS